RRAVTAGEIDRREQRFPVWRANDGDRIGGAVVAGAGLVADLPVLWQAGAQPAVADFVADHPVLKLARRRRAQGAFRENGLERVSDRRRCRRVARIASNGRVECGLSAVETGDLVAERPRIAGEACRSADLLEKQVGGGVVAPL